VAGIGGVSLGVFLLLFRDIIQKSIFPTLASAQAYRLLQLITVAVWSIAIVGIGAWAYVSVNDSRRFSGVPTAGPTAPPEAAAEPASRNVTPEEALVGSYQVILGPKGGCGGGQPFSRPDRPAHIFRNQNALFAENECGERSRINILNASDIIVFYPDGFNEHVRISIAGSAVTLSADDGNTWKKLTN
jgi:hypothetical protein